MDKSWEALSRQEKIDALKRYKYKFSINERDISPEEFVKGLETSLSRLISGLMSTFQEDNKGE